MDEINNNYFVDIRTPRVISLHQMNMHNLRMRNLRSRLRMAGQHMQISSHNDDMPVASPIQQPREPSVTEENGDEFIPLRKVIQVEYNVKEKAINDVCSICLSTSTYITTQCRHGFCSCLMKHLKKRSFCPYCRDTVEKMYCSDEKCFDCMKNGNIDDDIFCFQ
jgi:hypothetical protein